MLRNVSYTISGYLNGFTEIVAETMFLLETLVMLFYEAFVLIKLSSTVSK
jgi:hypothetical protein